MIQFIMKHYICFLFLIMFKISQYQMMILRLQLLAQVATYTVLVFMTHFIIKSIKIRKGINISKQQLIHVQPMIIGSALLLLRKIKMRSLPMIEGRKLILHSLLDVQLKNIWSCTKINARIQLLSSLLLIVILHQFLYVQFRGF